MLGLARTGATADNGSGDLTIAFSTGNRIPRTGQIRQHTTWLADDSLDPLFAATVEATEMELATDPGGHRNA